jgi:hypothetical protein
MANMAGSGWPSRRIKSVEGEGDPLIKDALDYVPGAKPLVPMEFVVENFVRTGLYVFYGHYFAGKTMSTLAVCLTVAGLLKIPGLPSSLRREVYYITEDPEQIMNFIEGYLAKGVLNEADYEKWFHIIPSKRQSSGYWSKKIRSVVSDDRVWGAPLIVFDTAPSNMDVENTSDNSKVSEFIAD